MATLDDPTDAAEVARLLKQSEHRWESFRDWWNEDWSWTGLESKSQEHPTNPYTPESLQDYWRDQENALIDFAGRKWTRFHLPPCDLDGNLASPYSAAKGDEFWEGLYARIYSARTPTRRNPLENWGGRERFDGVVFPGWQRRSDPDLVLDANFGLALFLGACDFSACKFASLFERARFVVGDVRFTKARFEKYATFLGARFTGGDIHFNDAQFLKGAFFAGAHFFDAATSFTYAQFFEQGHFGGAYFSGLFVDFAFTLFDGEANFGRAKFSCKPSFWNAQLQKATFEQAVFSGHSQFEGCRFSGDVSFLEVRFPENANFQKSEFVEGEVSFKDVLFLKDACFDDAKFAGSTSFLNAEFSGQVSFARARFGGETIFRGSGSFKGLVNFANASFDGDVDFSNRLFTNYTFFTGARFAVPPRFHNCTLHPETFFDETAFSDEIGQPCWEVARYTWLELRGGLLLSEEEEATPERDRPPRSEGPLTGWFCSESGQRFLMLYRTAVLRRAPFGLRWPWMGDVRAANDFVAKQAEYALRTLRKLSEENTNIEDELKFYNLEIDARRARTDVPLFERFIATIFKWTSLYGTSPGRVLAVFVSLFIATIFGGYLALVVWKGEHAPRFWDVAPFVGRNFIPPPLVWSSREALPRWVQCDPNNYPPGHVSFDPSYLCMERELPGLLLTVGSIQTLTFVAFVALFLLALRRRFQIRN
jgi:uncharacterized protein YjbI with pentapeptide repeats